MSEQELPMITVPFELLYGLYGAITAYCEMIEAEGAEAKEYLDHLVELEKQTSSYLFPGLKADGSDRSE